MEISPHYESIEHDLYELLHVYTEEKRERVVTKLSLNEIQKQLFFQLRDETKGHSLSSFLKFIDKNPSKIADFLTGYTPTGLKTKEKNALFLNFLKDKKVVIVGPAAHIKNSQLGKEIDSFDIVVRVNHGPLLSREYPKDFGSRTDVLYHCCNMDAKHSPFPNMLKFFCYEQGVMSFPLRHIAQKQDISTIDITELYITLSHFLKTHPYTGMVAIAHLLATQLKGLHVIGFTWMQTPYIKAYYRSETSAGLHNSNLQFLYFKNLAQKDSRISFDDTLRALMDYI